jgi:acetyltransferase-like isoleucine patch superfamily enzyme
VLEFSFSALPQWVKAQGTWGADCVLRLAPETAAAGERGQFKLHLVHKGDSRAHSGIQITLGCRGGQLTIGIGGDGHVVTFGPRTSGQYDLRLWRPSSVQVGADTTSNGVRMVCNQSDVVIGEDCMFSDEIVLQSADQHPIIDLKAGRVINNVRRRMVLADHVWVGRCATLLPDVQIGRGAIIGAGAIVSHDVPATSVAVGVPARVVRSDTSWSRQFGKMDEQAQALLQSYGHLPPAE